MSRILTPKAILSYPHLYEPVAAEDGGEAKYSCCLVFEPGTDLSELEKAAMEVGRAKWGDKLEGYLKTKKVRWPIRNDENEKYGEGYRFVNVRSATRPTVVDGSLRVIDESRSSEVYPGCVVVASVSAFAYEGKTNTGISFGLGNIQKVSDGKRLDGRKDAADEFEVIPGSELEFAAAELI